MTQPTPDERRKETETPHEGEERRRPSRLPLVRTSTASGTKLPKQGTLRWSFTWAFEGLVYVLRTQRNMQVHMGVAVIAVLMALVLNLSRLEVLAVLLAVSLVIVAEMFNTAIEAAVDAVVNTFHPLAKTAKDVAAGAVLVAVVNAAAVAYLVFYGQLSSSGAAALRDVKRAPTHIVVIALIVTVILTATIKAVTGSGTPLRGGFPSGHAATAFSAWSAVTLLTADRPHAAIVSTLAFLMALLVAQSRVEAGIHTGVEVLAGAILGTGVTVLLFQIWG